MGKSSAPSAPDPYTTAQAQAQYGEQAASYNSALNNVNTISPTGSTTYQITGHDPTTGAPIYTQTTALSQPEQQILGASQTQQLGQLGSAGTALGLFNSTLASGAPSINPIQYGVAASAPVQTTLNTSNVPGIANVQGLEQYGQSTALAGEEAAMQPGMSQQYEQLDASLRNSGAVPGTPAYDNAMAAFDANMNNAQTQAAGAAITAGTGLQNTNYGESANTNSQIYGQDASTFAAENAAAGQQYGQNLSSANLSNTAGQMSLQDWANELGVPLSAISALIGGTGVQMPTTTTPATSQTSAPNIESDFQNAYAGQLAGYNANVSTENAGIGALGSLGAAATMYFL